MVDPLTLWLYLRDAHYQLVIPGDAVIMSDPFEDVCKPLEDLEASCNPVAIDEVQSIAKHFVLHPHGEHAVQYKL